MSTPVAGRSAGVDAIRVLGIVAVVVGHVWTDSAVVRDVVYTWHVPVFFFLSGYFWTRGRPRSRELYSRWRSLGVPYLFWLIAISTVYLLVLWDHDALTFGTAIRPLLGGSYAGRPYSAFWFVSALFVVCLLYRLIEWTPYWAQWGLAASTLCLAYVFPGVVAQVPLGAASGAGALVFVLAGGAFRQIRMRIPVPTFIALAGLTIATTLVAAGWSAPLDIKKGDFGTPVLSVVTATCISAALVILGEELVPLLGVAAGRTIIDLSRCGLTVVLTHAGVLWAIQTAPSGSVLALGLALAVPWCAALVLLHTRFAPITLGVPSCLGRGS